MAAKTKKTTEASDDSNEFAAMLEKVEKQHGNIVTSAKKLPTANHIPTGAFMLDYALLGGVPEGYATMFYGYESSGKTMITKKTVASFQRKHPDKQAVWIDAEGMFDKDWAQALGCDLDRLHIVRPTTGNEAVDMIEALMEPKEVGLIALDSIPGCVPQRIVEKSAEDSTMGELARLMGIMCSKILCSWSKERRRNHWVTMLMINQFRMKIGAMFGDPRTLPGGRQINHLPTTKIELKNNEIGGKDTFDTNMMIRNEHHFKITKAKHGRSVREGEFHMSLKASENDGVSEFDFINHKAAISFAKKLGVFGGGAGKFRIECIPNQVFRTMDEAGMFLIQHPEAMYTLQRHLISMQRVDKGLPALPKDGYLVGPAPSVRRSINRGMTLIELCTLIVCAYAVAVLLIIAALLFFR